METYSLSDLGAPLDPEQDYMEQFRTAAADIMSTVDINPYTQRLRDVEAMGSLSQLASPALGMTEPMMGQMMDPTMLPPEMMGNTPQTMGMGGSPMQPTMNDIQDPNQMAIGDTANMTMGNNLGI